MSEESIMKPLLKYKEPEPYSDQMDIQNKTQSQLTIEDVLNQIFPPKIIETDNGKFIQMVLAEDSQREDLDKLEVQITQNLFERQARKNGICPVREDLHNQLFDEIIRQCTINSPERGKNLNKGLLLLKVRDQLRMSISEYQTLYDGSIIYGIKKSVEAEQDMQEMETKIQELEKQLILLENKKIYLENEMDIEKRSFEEIREAEEVRRQQELQFLKNQNKHLESFYKTVKQQSQD